MFLLPALKRLHNGCEQARCDERCILKVTHKDDINKIGDFATSVTWASPPGHPWPVMTGIWATESWLKQCARSCMEMDRNKTAQDDFFLMSKVYTGLWPQRTWKKHLFFILCDNQHCCVMQALAGVLALVCRYLQLVDHLVKQFSSFGAVGVFKVVLYTDLNHDGLQIPAHTCTSGRIQVSVHTYIWHKATTIKGTVSSSSWVQCSVKTLDSLLKWSRALGVTGVEVRTNISRPFKPSLQTSAATSWLISLTWSNSSTCRRMQFLAAVEKGE